MSEQLIGINQNLLFLSAGAVVGIFIVLQLLLTIFMLTTLKSASKERADLYREMFGLMRRIEGLTAQRREQILKHYDGMLEVLSTKLPPTIAARTSELIYETESKILARLAELEPALHGDDAAKKKMDDLIKNMENLEHTIVALASDAVQRVMAEGRRSLLDDERYAEIQIAA